MSKKKKEVEKAADPNAWMLSFSDTLTNLLCFFVLLLTMSSMDVKRLKETFGFFDGASGPFAMAREVKVTTGAQAIKPIVPTALAIDVAQSLRRYTANGSPPLRAAALALAPFSDQPDFLVIAHRSDGLHIDVSHQHLFEDENRLTPDGTDLLRAIGAILDETPLSLRVVVWCQQATELAPLWKQGPDSWDKSLKRAGAVLRPLAERSDRLDKIGLSGRGDGTGTGESVVEDPNRVSLIFLAEEGTDGR